MTTTRLMGSVHDMDRQPVIVEATAAQSPTLSVDSPP